MRNNKEIEKQIEDKCKLISDLVSEIHQVVIGQQTMINRLLIGLFTNGHILLEGVPGLAKTLTVSTLANALTLKYQRIQFTPDLLPADLIGTLIYNPKDAKFEVKKGPVFANVILADEINRSPAKVQSALLEAMQEKQVTIGDETFKLDRPFLVLATQNPIDQEGTYPLPEAQVDRFMMKIYVDYPTKEEELKIMRLMSRTTKDHRVNQIIDKNLIFEIRDLIENISLEPRLENYIINIVMATRDPGTANLKKLKKYIEYGASPRASIGLNLASKSLAFLKGRSYVMPQDIKEIAFDVLNHRLILSYEADADKFTSRDCVQEILNHVEI